MRAMSVFGGTLGLLGLSTAHAVQVGDIHACMLHHPRLAAQSRACAAPRVIGTCWNHFGPFSWPGDVVQVWIPDTVVEVTPRFGRSLLAEGKLGAALKPQLEAAAKRWELGIAKYTGGLSAIIPKWAKDGMVDHSNGGSSFLFGRVTPLAFGKLAFPLTGVAPARGKAYPLCFDAVSEFQPEIWGDLPESPDRAVAGLTQVPAIMRCIAPLASAANAVSGQVAAVAESDGVGKLGLSAGYYYGRDWARTARNSGSACASPIANPLSIPGVDCAANTGNIRPRTGKTDFPDAFRASMLVSQRILSLGFEKWGAPTEVEKSEKWQLLFPRVAPFGNAVAQIPVVGQIFGSAADPSNCFFADGITPFLGVELRNPPFTTADERAYVYVVWKLRQVCTGATGLGAAYMAAWQTALTMGAGACSAINASFPPPEGF